MNDNGALVFANPLAQTFSGQISGNGQVVKQGSGLLVLSGASTYAGATTITAGTLAVSSGSINGGTFIMGNSGLPSDTPTYTQSGGSVTANGSVYLGGYTAGTGLSTFNLSGGNFTTNATMSVASNGNAVANISGGSLSVGNFWAGLNARFPAPSTSRPEVSSSAPSLGTAVSRNLATTRVRAAS